MSPGARSDQPPFPGPRFRVPDLTGRTIVVTGGNRGVGRGAARALAAGDARVVIAARDLRRCDATAREIGGNCEVRRLDLADLGSVHAFAAAWDGPIDILINNAGVMIPPRGRTDDGVELQFAVNYLGHFALSNLLLPHVRGRVVTVSSNAHRLGRIDFEDLQWERRRYRAALAYAQSKLACLLFTSELQRRLAAAGSSVISTAAHPGYAVSELGGSASSRLFRWAYAVALRVFAQDEDAAALPILHAALADVPPASYSGPDGMFEQRGRPTLVGRSAAASSAADAHALWAASEELTGIGFSESVLTGESA